MLRWRITLGILFAVALAGLCWLDAVNPRPGAVLLVVAAGLAALAAGEMRRMYAERGVLLRS